MGMFGRWMSWTGRIAAKYYSLESKVGFLVPFSSQGLVLIEPTHTMPTHTKVVRSPRTTRLKGERFREATARQVRGSGELGRPPRSAVVSLRCLESNHVARAPFPSEPSYRKALDCMTTPVCFHHLLLSRLQTHQVFQLVVACCNNSNIA